MSSQNKQQRFSHETPRTSSGDHDFPLQTVNGISNIRVPEARFGFDECAKYSNIRCQYSNIWGMHHRFDVEYSNIRIRPSQNSVHWLQMYLCVVVGGAPGDQNVWYKFNSSLFAFEWSPPTCLANYSFNCGSATYWNGFRLWSDAISKTRGRSALWSRSALFQCYITSKTSGERGG